MSVTQYRLEPLGERDARDILSWRYPHPYDFYNPPDDRQEDAYVAAFLEPDLHFHAVRSQDVDLAGFCSFGVDGQVPGGVYTNNALDIGLGMRPALTGRGSGEAFFAAILEHAVYRFCPERFRLTVARFNRRALKVYTRMGFEPESEFDNSRVHYLVLSRAI